MKSLATASEKIQQYLQDGSLPVEVETQVKAIHDPVIRMRQKLNARFKTTLDKGDNGNFVRFCAACPKKSSMAFSFLIRLEISVGKLLLRCRTFGSDWDFRCSTTFLVFLQT
jgi:hypothetical protein